MRSQDAARFSVWWRLTFRFMEDDLHAVPHMTGRGQYVPSNCFSKDINLIYNPTATSQWPIYWHQDNFYLDFLYGSGDFVNWVQDLHTETELGSLFVSQLACLFLRLGPTKLPSWTWMWNLPAGRTAYKF